MRRRQISQQNSAGSDPLPRALTAPGTDGSPRPAPGPATNKPRGWPRGKPRKPGVSKPYVKGSPV